MKHFLLIFFSLVLLLPSCNKKEIIKTETQIVSIDMDRSKELSDVDLFEKIELIPLETQDASLVGRLKKIITVKDKYYITVDEKHIVTIFDNNGKYISNSSKMYGNGPGEYMIYSDIAYNSQTNKIEILNSTGIKAYDNQFDFSYKRELPDNMLFHRFYPIGSDEYILINGIYNPESLYFFDSKKSAFSDTITYDHFATVTANNPPFSQVGSTQYFCPYSASYYIFTLDCQKHSLTPVFQFDFGSKNIDPKQLSRFGLNGREKNPENEYSVGTEINDFLLNESNLPLPLKSLVSDQYLVTWIIRNNKPYYNIYNTKTKKGQLMPYPSKIKDRNPYFFAIDGNVLIALVQPYELSNYVDMNLVNPEDKEKVKQLTEESNPVIVRYYIK